MITGVTQKKTQNSFYKKREEIMVLFENYLYTSKYVLRTNERGKTSKAYQGTVSEVRHGWLQNSIFSLIKEY